MAQLVKNPPAMRDLGSVPELGRPLGEGQGCPLQYSGLENSTDCIVYGIAKRWTRLSDFHFHPKTVRRYLTVALICVSLISDAVSFRVPVGHL